MDDGRADAAADAHRVARGDEFGGMAERTGDVLDRVARFEGHQFTGGLADRLDHEGDRAPVGIGVGDRQRNALGAIRPADDDELAGLADRGDARRFDLKPGDVRAELGLGGDGVHEANW